MNGTAARQRQVDHARNALQADGARAWPPKQRKGWYSNERSERGLDAEPPSKTNRNSKETSTLLGFYGT